jgi:HSP20 family molecular chaperone IbpA
MASKKKNGLKNTVEIVPHVEIPKDLLLNMDKALGEARRVFTHITALGHHKGVRTPRIDIVDGGREFIVRADIPGVPRNRVRVDVTSHSLQISADRDIHKESKGKGVIHHERRHSSYKRILSLPALVEPKKFKIKMTDGVLEITIPKKPARK